MRKDGYINETIFSDGEKKFAASYMQRSCFGYQ